MAKKMGILTNAQNKMMKMNYYKLLNCRSVLYFILILALSDLFYFAMEKDYLFCGIFILIGFLTSFFSKNMMVILVIAIALTNILRFGKSATVNEGMEDNQDELLENLEENDDSNDDSNKNKVEDEGDGMEAITSLNISSKKTSTSPSANDMVAGLDEQTTNLIQQQKTLMKNMENLTPLLQNAESLMEKFQSLNA